MKLNPRVPVCAVSVIALSLAMAACGGKEERKAMHMEKGRSYYAQANFDKARIEFKNVLQIDPRSADGYYMMGRVEQEQQNWSNAFADYRKAVELDPQQVDAKVLMGRLYVLSGAADEAQKIADDVLSSHPGHPGGLYLKAAVLARRGEFSEAVAEAQRAIEADRTLADAVSLLAGLYSRAGDDEKAQRVLEDGVRANPNSVELRGDFASVLLKRKAYPQAEQVFRDIVQIDPGKYVYRTNLAAFYNNTNQPEKAEKALRDAVDADPEDTQRYLVLVDFLAANKGPAAAETELTSAIAAKPKVYPLRFSLARLYELTARLDPAERVYREIIASDKTGPYGLRARNSLARLKAATGNTVEADRLIAEVVKDNPKDSDALQLRAQMALARGDAKRAIADLRAILKDHPDSPEIVSQLAAAHTLNHEPQLARDVLDNAIVRYPNNAALRVALALFLVRGNDHGGAGKELDAALQLDPKNVQALQLKADMQTAGRDLAGAEQTLAKLKLAVPEQPLAYYRLGLLYQAQKKYDQALSEFETAYAKSPGALDALTAIVNVRLAQNKPDEVVARLSKAIEARPNDAAPYTLLAEVYRNNNTLTDAERMFQKAVEIGPRSTAAYWGLSNVHAARGDNVKAVAALRQGLAANPEDRSLTLALAETYQRTGEIDRSIAEYDKLLARNPRDDVAANNVAAILTDSKADAASIARALQLAERFEDSTDPSALDTLGWVYFKAGRNDRALELLQRAADGAPQSAPIQYHLGMAYYKQGDATSAKAHLQRAVAANVSFGGLDEAREVLAKL